MTYSLGAETEREIDSPMLSALDNLFEEERTQEDEQERGEE